MITYCGHCAGKIDYQLTKPSSCPKCGKPLSSAFKVEVKPPTPAPIAVASVPTPTAPSYSSPAPSRAPRVRPTKMVRGDDGEMYDDYYDENEAHAAAQEMIRGINAESFFKPLPRNTDIITFSDVVNGRVQE